MVACARKRSRIAVAAGVTEKDAPVLRRSIRGDECRRRFVTADEDLEQVLGRVGAELLHAEVFEHEQVDAGELLDERARAGLRLGEVGGEIEGAAHERAAPARIAPMAIAVATCDLPTPGGPIRSTPLCVSTKRALANSTIFALGIFG